MTLKVVRDSKFRHVFGEALKERYDDLRPASKATESAGLRVNGKFLALTWESGGGGTLAVIPIKKTGRLPHGFPLITGHTGGILDYEFNPFDDNMVATASEDTTVKLWTVPDEGLKEHLKDPLLTLEGHSKKVAFCSFNRSAGHIIASAGFDLKCKIWNAVEQEEAFSMDVPEQVNHLKWNYNGSLLAMTCKDKKLHIVDPRAQKIAASCEIHKGMKGAKVEWMGSAAPTDECHKLITTGLSQRADREIGVWDMRKFSADGAAPPMNLLQLEQGTGALFPTFDPGTGMLYIAGKGDGNVRFFEMTHEEPFIHYISVFSSTVPQKGFDFYPKRFVDTTCHEVMRGMKLEASSVLPVSFRVPRKADYFQEDIFPDCFAGAPSMTADDWIGGAESRAPLLASMRPGEGGSDAVKRASVSSAAGAPVVTMKDLKRQLAEAQERIAALEKENAMLKEQLGQKSA